jgi:hypothetical protein
VVRRQGIHEHHKFVVTDFSLSACRVPRCSPGSSNLSPRMEAGNRNNLLMIEDHRVAIS